jgi:hypothetical protein
VLERLRGARVHDEADIRAIDPHAERHRRHDNISVLVEERILVAMPLQVGQTCVVRERADASLHQPRRQRIDFAARGAVDDPRLTLTTGEDVLNLPLQLRAREHAINQVGTIERSHQLNRLAQLELSSDVAADPCGGCGRERVQADRGERRAQASELTIFRSEVVPPLTDAVRLVDGNETEVAAREPGEEAIAAVPRKALGRDVEQPVAAFAHPASDRGLLVRAQRAVVQRGGHTVADQRVDLILHQRDERRHDDA